MTTQTTILVSLAQRVLQILENATAAELKAETGLTARQLAVLETIDRMTADGAKPMQIQLVATSGIDRSTLSDVIRRLVKRDLAIRTTSKKDGRAKQVKLTVPGRKALKAGLDIVTKSDADLIAKYRLATTMKSLEAFVRQHGVAAATQTTPAEPAAAPDPKPEAVLTEKLAKIVKKTTKPKVRVLAGAKA